MTNLQQRLIGKVILDIQRPPGVSEISTDTATSQFLRRLLANINEAEVPYAVLRNYEGLPDRPGRDIDILTADFAQFKKILFETAKEESYYILTFRKYSGMVKYHLIRPLITSFSIIEIDLAWSLRWKGIPLAPHDLLEKNRIWRNDFYILRPGSEAAITLTKNLIYQGCVLEKYFPLLPVLAGKDKEGFLISLEHCFGRHLTEKLYSLTCQADWPHIQDMVPELRQMAIRKALKGNPPAQLGRWLTFFWWNFWKYIYKRGLFVVLIGPDGSGKSTVAAGLKKYLQPLFQGTQYYHFRFGLIPRLRDLLQPLGFKAPDDSFGPNPTTTKPQDKQVRLNKFRSYLYLLYYSLDFFLGHLMIIRDRGHGKLIIFDRYIYDYLIQQTMSLPDKLTKMVLHFLPHPDAVIYLKNDPKIIFSRKPELALQELKRQSIACSRLISQLSNGYIVKTTGAPEEVIQTAGKLLIEKLLQRAV